MVGDVWIDVATLHVGDAIRLRGYDLATVEYVQLATDARAALSTIGIYDWTRRFNREVHSSVGVAGVKLAWCPHERRSGEPVV